MERAGVLSRRNRSSILLRGAYADHYIRGYVQPGQADHSGEHGTTDAYAPTRHCGPDTATQQRRNDSEPTDLAAVKNDEHAGFNGHT